MSERGANTESEANVCQHTQEKKQKKFTLACNQAKKMGGEGRKRKRECPSVFPCPPTPWPLTTATQN